MPGRAWGPWMRDLGMAIRQGRETLGLSQHQLATLAGISQGAVSRLEAGRGLATPLVVALRVLSVLQRSLENVPAAVVPKSLELLLTLSRTGRDGPTAEVDRRLASFLELYRGMTTIERNAVLDVAMTTVTAIRSRQAG